jgi:hypothetical protein
MTLSRRSDLLPKSFNDPWINLGVSRAREAFDRYSSIKSDDFTFASKEPRSMDNATRDRTSSYAMLELEKPSTSFRGSISSSASTSAARLRIRGFVQQTDSRTRSRCSACLAGAYSGSRCLAAQRHMPTPGLHLCDRNRTARARSP